MSGASFTKTKSDTTDMLVGGRLRIGHLVVLLPDYYRILKFICSRLLRKHGKNCNCLRRIAKGLLEAKIMQNTEENQAFCGMENLSHNLEVVGSNPAPATSLFG
jgi:hypothetical protein